MIPNIDIIPSVRAWSGNAIGQHYPGPTYWSESLCEPLEFEAAFGKGTHGVESGPHGDEDLTEWLEELCDRRGNYFPHTRDPEGKMSSHAIFMKFVHRN